MYALRWFLLFIIFLCKISVGKSVEKCQTQTSGCVSMHPGNLWLVEKKILSLKANNSPKKNKTKYRCGYKRYKNRSPRPFREHKFKIIPSVATTEKVDDQAEILTTLSPLFSIKQLKICLVVAPRA